mgnify:CR=1 FL=1
MNNMIGDSVANDLEGASFSHLENWMCLAEIRNMVNSNLLVHRGRKPRSKLYPE